MAASVGTVWVDVKFNIGDVTRQLQTALAAANQNMSGLGAAPAALERTWSQSLTNIGTKMQATGRQMTMGLTLPLALIGKSAVTSFNEFDKAMTQITAINKINAETTNRWRDEVRELGLAYGVAGEEAAKGLYYITSSGVAAEDALGVLEVALKGAAVGFGETQVVADVLTSALNAYGKANLSAAKAGDILAAAVDNGKGEADELAGALSQVIPIAANLDVKFGEVAGAMAAMTLSGTSADQAATQLRGLFNTLQDMPPISQRALEQYTGLNYQNMRLKLTTEGLIPTLKTMFDAFGDNKAALAEVFGNIRAMTGIMNLFGKNTEETLRIVREVTEASGNLNDAWEITAQSKSKQMELSMNRLHNAFLGIGEDVVPMVTKVAGAFGALASTVDNLPGPLKAVTVGLGGILTVAGPLTVVAGSMARAAGALGEALTRSAENGSAAASRLTGMAATIGKVSGALAIGATGWAIYANAMASAEQAGKETQAMLNALSLTGGMADADKEIAEITSRIAGLEKEVSDFKNVSPVDFGKMILMPWTAGQKALDLDYIFKQVPEQIEAAKRSIAQIETRKRVANELAAATGKNADATYRWLASEEKGGHVYKTFEEAQRGFVAALLKGDEAATKLAESNVVVAGSIEDITNKAKAAGDMFFAVRDAEEAQADAQRKVADSQQKLADAQQDVLDAQQKTVQADAKIVESQRKVADASRATADARLKLADAERELQDALAGPSEEETIDLESARLDVAEAQKALRGKFEDPLDRRRAQLQLRRAQIALEKQGKAHDERVADARKAVADAEKGVNDAVAAELAAQQAVVDARNARADASRGEASARDAVAAAELGVRDANRELFDATSNMVTKQGEFNTALMSGTINANWLLEYLNKLKEMYPHLAGEIEGYIKRVGDAQANAANRMPTPPPGPAPAPAPVAPPAPPITPLPDYIDKEGMPYHPDSVLVPGKGWRLRRRAAGGPLSTGNLATVNERGLPELWSAGGKQYLIPTMSGQVTPLKPLDVPLSARGHDGVTIGGNIIVQGAEDPVATAYEVRRQLRTKTRTRGRS